MLHIMNLIDTFGSYFRPPEFVTPKLPDAGRHDWNRLTAECQVLLRLYYNKVTFYPVPDSVCCYVVPGKVEEGVRWAGQNSAAEVSEFLRDKTPLRGRHIPHDIMIDGWFGYPLWKSPPLTTPYPDGKNTTPLGLPLPYE